MLHNMAKMTVSGTPGTGTITLGGTVSGFQDFASAGVVDAEEISYSISDGSDWEVGRGIYTASGTTLSRGPIYSSNSNAAISASSSAIVFIAALAEDINPFQPPAKKPIDSQFSWTNQGGASVTVNPNGGIFLKAPATASTTMRIRRLAAPSTPYTLTAAFLPMLVGKDYHEGGLLFRESGTSKISTLDFLSSNSGAPYPFQYHCAHWTNESSFGADSANAPMVFAGAVHWFRISDDGTNLKYSVSHDGFNFLQLLSEARNAFFTTAPDQVGFWCLTNNTTWDAGITLASWSF